MTCIQPGLFSDLELLEYSFAQLDEDRDIHDHIQQCSYCREKVAGMQQALQQFPQKMERFDCPSSTMLDAYIDNDVAQSELTSQQRQDVKDHLLRCTRCSEEVALSLQFFQQQDRLLEWVSPPLVEQVVKHVRRFIAALMPDTATGKLQLRGFAPHRPEVRGNANAVADLNMYTVDDISVALWKFSGVAYVLEGIVASDTISAIPPSITVKLVAQDSNEILVTQADIGSFAFDVAASGIYTLEIELEDRIIAIESIEF